MKFCVIENEKGQLWGKEYEAPYRYSTYTAGGGTFWGMFVDRSNLVDSDPDGLSDECFHMVSIFESEEKAKEFIKSRRGFEDAYGKVKIINLGDI